MKLLTGCLALTLALVACGGGRDDKSSAGSSATTQKTVETTTTANAATPLPTATPSPANVGGEPPVEVTYTGVTPDKESIAYKVKVNTAKKVTQVDLDIKYTDEGGRVVDENTYAWQNVVKSVRKPIERGQTYEATDPMPDGAVRAEVTLKRVHFEDGTRWEAEK